MLIRRGGRPLHPAAVERPDAKTLPQNVSAAEPPMLPVTPITKTTLPFPTAQALSYRNP
jgi:hypothetical protein